MPPVTLLHRIYFAAVGSFALWVGIWGYLIPAEVARAIPWQVPPLHSRFIGSMYLSGMVLMLGGLFARTLAEVRIAVPMAAIWTGMLMLVSLLHLKEFDFGHRPVWFWFFAYILYPLAGAWLAWKHHPIPEPDRGAHVDGWMPAYFTAQGIGAISLSLCLFLFPSFMAGVWPWKITTLLAQIYSGPFLSYGIGSLLLARCTRAPEVRLPAASMLAFALLVLIASFMHRALFTAGSASAIVWFGGFIIAALVLGVITLRTVQPSRQA